LCYKYIEFFLFEHKLFSFDLLSNISLFIYYDRLYGCDLIFG
jgi:hypothetical protein